MNKNIEGVLQKHPNYSLYKKVTEEMVDLAVEECFAKGRWSDLEQEKEKENESSRTSKPLIYDEDDNVIDFHHVKATDLKSNKRVNIVESGDLLYETKCEYLKIN